MQDVSQFTPEQMAEVLKQERVAQDLSRKLLAVLQTHKAIPNTALAALASVSGLVMNHIPLEIRDKFFLGFQQAVRDASFQQSSIGTVLTVPAPPKPKM